MKKLVAISLSLAMLCTLAACSSGGDIVQNDVPEEYYDAGESMGEDPSQESNMITILCAESASAMDTLGFTVSGQAVSMLFDEGAGEALSIEFWTAENTNVGTVMIADSGVVFYANDSMYEATWSLSNGVVDIAFSQCYFTLDNVGFVQAFLVKSDGSNEFLARVEIADIERIEAIASQGDAAAGMTYDSVSYHTYDINGNRVDDMLQIDADGEYLQVTLFGRYQSDPILMTDNEDSNDFLDDWFSLSYNSGIDLETGEEVFINLDLHMTYFYDVAPEEVGQTWGVEVEDLFYGDYMIKVNTDDGRRVMQDQGTFYADLSQSVGVSQRTADYMGTYIGQDGAPNVTVTEDGFVIDGMVTYSIPIAEYSMAQYCTSYFHALDNDGNEVWVYMSHGGGAVSYTIYDSACDETIYKGYAVKEG